MRNHRRQANPENCPHRYDRSQESEAFRNGQILPNRDRTGRLLRRLERSTSEQTNETHTETSMRLDLIDLNNLVNIRNTLTLSKETHSTKEIELAIKRVDIEILRQLKDIRKETNT